MLKYAIFQNSRWRRPPFCENRQVHISVTVRGISTKVGVFFKLKYFWRWQAVTCSLHVVILSLYRKWWQVKTLLLQINNIKKWFASKCFLSNQLSSQTASRSVQLLSQVSRTWPADIQTDKPTDRPTTPLRQLPVANAAMHPFLYLQTVQQWLVMRASSYRRLQNNPTCVVV